MQFVNRFGIPMIVLVMILVVLAVSLLFINIPSNDTYEETLATVLLMGEVTYDQGYTDHQMGIPKGVRDNDELQPNNDFEKVISGILWGYYERGYSDAADGEPSWSQQMSDIREQQLEVLGKLQTSTEEALRELEELRDHLEEVK